MLAVNGLSAAYVGIPIHIKHKYSIFKLSCNRFSAALCPTLCHHGLRFFNWDELVFYINIYFCRGL